VFVNNPGQEARLLYSVIFSVRRTLSVRGNLAVFVPLGTLLRKDIPILFFFMTF
jgi:hypothetical protein